jgi:hypothetical protein
LTSTIQLQASTQKSVLIPIDSLKPHEKGSPLYLELLKQEILKDDILKYPIIVDEKTHVILDGMHRWLALKSLGYSLIPVILVNAIRNTEIRIGKRRVHRYASNPEEEISIEKVISAGLSGNLMNPRSTRHFFPFPKPKQINQSLASLMRGEPQDVSLYLANLTKNECRLAIREWLDEITEELNFLDKRKEEVEKERAEFLHRIRNLQNNGSLF